MKSQRILATLSLGALMCAGYSTASAQAANKPVIITPPAVRDGSNWSRAPFPAQRQFNDVTRPDGQAIDTSLPPNTPATNMEPAVPAPVVAVMVPAGSTVVATTTEPVLTPTGRPTVYATEAARTIDHQRITPPSIRDGSNWSRAPFPAKRQFDDVKSPDGQVVDAPVPQNVTSSN